MHIYLNMCVKNSFVVVFFNNFDLGLQRFRELSHLFARCLL